jgi:hypothetical protein
LAEDNNSNSSAPGSSSEDAARGPVAPLADLVPEPSTWEMMLVGLAGLGPRAGLEGHF